jgi:hypothetical protein
VNNRSIPSTHAERKITVSSHEHFFTPYPSLSPYRQTDRITDGGTNKSWLGWVTYGSSRDEHVKSTIEKKLYGRNPYNSVPVAKTYSTYLLTYVPSSRKGTCLCRNMVPAKRNSWKSTLGKKGILKGIPLFCRNLEVIPQDSWNWKAKKRNTKRNAQSSPQGQSQRYAPSLLRHLSHRS